ncbi:beta-1,4 N-acetylgalactosaminyltransferase 2-like, partial [Saccoglossus kowalevskii]|uniref:Beta-1,4 N-acetylgalactosaminyltransferase 2-like n=1 Tax=Saccoglossus kowalevskii TaxID=10224 RepID=A0ABM0MNG8_SACKO
NKYGVLSIAGDFKYSGTIKGIQTPSLSIHFGKDVNKINNLLSRVIYTGTVYRIDVYDTIEVSFDHFTFDIAIHIKRQPLPDRIDPGESGSIGDKITVIMKTFERPELVKPFVDAVHSFYPNMTIIIADDSQNPVPFQKDRVKYYTMNFRDGTYPGINLALSQVDTKYVLYSDDDFVFTKETRLELMLEKLEDPCANVDIVVADVIGLPRLGPLWRVGYNESGKCIMGVRTVRPKYVAVPGYPQCVHGDFFENFLLSKIVLLRKIGFYPPIRTSTHLEFWTNSIGKAHIARCDDVTVAHNHVHNPVYDKYRNEVYSLAKKGNPAPLFENDLCYDLRGDFGGKSRRDIQG